MRHSLWLVGTVLLTACGPNGVLSGKVSVEGGSAGGIAVIVYGPQSAATVTGDDGTFSVGSLPDGRYVVRATVAGADVEEQTATTTITQGKASPEPVLSFRASTAKVTGRVVLADGSEASDLTVVAVGPETRSARTATDGSFTFEGLKTGGYVVSVEAKDTKEGRVSVGVNASGAAPAIELRLTPVGRIGGAVTYNSMPAAGVPVMVTGTSLSAVTDAQGRFFLEGVPTGMQALLARVGSEPFFRSATATVTIVRGANPDQALTLTDDPPRTGTVTGVITFHGPRSPRDITISAPGTSATAQPAVNGAYSLTLPVGVWDVVANAPLHPQKLLGRVTVVAGQSQALVGQELSWYRPIWVSSTNITGGPTAVGFSLTSPDTLSWGLITFSDGSERLALGNHQTGELRILATGSASSATLSRNAKYVAWAIGTTAFVYEVATGAITPYWANTSITTLEFSTDESALFIVRTGSTLTRLKFSGAPASETFPVTGTSPEITRETVDRWFVREPGTSNDVRLVTPRTDVSQIFTNVNGGLFMSPTAWALTACTTVLPVSCELRVLGPTSESPAPRVAIPNPAPGAVTAFASSSRSSRADYPCFSIGGTSALCVKTADNSVFSLAAVPSQFKLNEAGDRVIWVHASGGNTVVREEAFPPPAASQVASNTTGYATGWLTPTRAYAYELGAASPRNLYLVKAGVSTTDADVGNQSISISGPLMVYPGAMGIPAKWKAVLGDGATRAVDVPVTQSLFALSSRAASLAAPAKYGVFSFVSGTAWLIDDMGLRQTTVGNAANPFSGGVALRSGPTEYVFLTRPGGTQIIYVHNTSSFLEYVDGTLSSTVLGSYANHAWISLLNDGRTIGLGRLQ